MNSSMDTRTWHDQKPTHRTMSTAEIDARFAEDAAWEAADDQMSNIHAQVHKSPDELDEMYENYHNLHSLALIASENLRSILRNR